MVELRDYQETALRELRLSIAAGRRRTLLVAPTGSGKTTIAAAMIQAAVRRDLGVLFLAHRKELIEQASARLDTFGVDHGIIKAGTSRVKPWELVQVASVQTLMNRKLPPAHLVIVDEAHRTLSATYRRILDTYMAADAWAVVGLTATPCRTDGRGLGDFYDDLVEAAKVEDLVAAGVLVEPVVYVPPPDRRPDLSGVEVSRFGDYNEAQLAAAMNKRELVGDIVAHWQRHAAGRLTVVFAASVEHSLAIRDQFREAGVVCEHIDGTTHELERARILADLRAGRVRVVTNCQVLTEGWDLPDCAVAVLARPTKSRGLYLQMVGRVLRSAPGKADAVILDHGGCAWQHGRPDEPQAWTLDTTRKREATAPPVKTCPECYAVLAPRVMVCVCGYEFDAASDGDGEQGIQHDTSVDLVRLDAGRPAGMPEFEQHDAWLAALWVPRPTQADKQWAYDAIAARWWASQRRAFGKPWRTGAIGAKFRKLWGTWPRGLREGCPYAEAIAAAKAREEMEATA
ncbi:MAG: DEAD/DEAH box helicase [Rhodospirillaceae bacterium]